VLSSEPQAIILSSCQHPQTIDFVCLPKIGTFFDAFLSYINRFPFFVPTAS